MKIFGELFSMKGKMEGFGALLPTKGKNDLTVSGTTQTKVMDEEKWWKDPNFKKTIKNLKLAVLVTLGNLLILVTKLYLNHMKEKSSQNRIFCQPPKFYFVLKEYEYLLFPAFILMAISTSIILIRIIREEYELMNIRKANLAQGNAEFNENPLNADGALQVV